MHKCLKKTLDSKREKKNVKSFQSDTMPEEYLALGEEQTHKISPACSSKNQWWGCLSQNSDDTYINWGV